ncbi:MAG: hypothetical protein K7J46_21940 [Bryobacter sp.]|jgi:hypothetical protein|nr:hypothetical protein [Bryobacter sp. CoA8 C33]
MDVRAAKIQLLREIRAIEDELEASFSRHHPAGAELKLCLLQYLRQSRITALLTVPFIYGCLIPFALLDLSLRLYESVCFPLYGIPRVRRSQYLIFDRGRLPYLNAIEKIHCFYCSYVNGLCAYATEIVARTEQHWCPVQHELPLRAPHSRYGKFFPYGDAQSYAQRIEQVRRDFADLQ